MKNLFAFFCFNIVKNFGSCYAYLKFLLKYNIRCTFQQLLQHKNKMSSITIAPFVKKRIPYLHKCNARPVFDKGNRKNVVSNLIAENTAI